MAGTSNPAPAAAAPVEGPPRHGPTHRVDRVAPTRRRLMGRRLRLLWERDADGSRRWTAAVGAGVGTAAVLGTMWWSAAPIHVGGVVGVLAVAAAVSSTVGIPWLTGWWDRIGFVVSAVLIAALVRVTGGADSNYQDLFLLIPVTSALTLPLRGFLLSFAAAVAGALAPVLYAPDSVTADYLANLAADAGVWLAAAAVIHVQVQRRREQQQELRAANEIKSTFLQATSHELRTPLTLILGISEILGRRIDDLPVDQRDLLLARLDSNAVRLRSLLDDLLDVDRLLRGVSSLERRPADLAQLVTRVLEGVDDRGHTITMVVEPLTAPVDTAKVERIVESLVANALRHTPAGAPIEVRLARSVDGALLTVDDGGEGVPEDLREAIFDPFVQGAVAAQEAQPGTGIGLTLVARFAELHGGRAWVEPSRLGGARFAVSLPVPSE